MIGRSRRCRWSGKHHSDDSTPRSGEFRIAAARDRQQGGDTGHPSAMDCIRLKSRYLRFK